MWRYTGPEDERRVMLQRELKDTVQLIYVVLACRKERLMITPPFRVVRDRQRLWKLLYYGYWTLRTRFELHSRYGSHGSA